MGVARVHERDGETESEKARYVFSLPVGVARPRSSDVGPCVFCQWRRMIVGVYGFAKVIRYSGWSSQITEFCFYVRREKKSGLDNTSYVCVEDCAWGRSKYHVGRDYFVHPKQT